MEHPFRKKWGQNFLQDPNIIVKIIECLEINHDDEILEIGPGNGALTDQLIKKVHHVHGVEIDPLLIKYLNEKKIPNLTLYESDILNWDFSILPKNIKIIGNLPFYISSPILFLLLNKHNWQKMVLMFQKEVAQRIISTPGQKSYGRLSIMCQTYAQVKIQFFVSKNVFYPKPDVDSAVVTFIPKENNLPEIEPFGRFIKQAFSQRRKKLKNNLTGPYQSGLLKKWSNMRPEELSVNDYIKLFMVI